MVRDLINVLDKPTAQAENRGTKGSKRKEERWITKHRQ